MASRPSSWSPFVVRADGWMIDGEHHSFNGPQYGYHVHAYVRAYAYTGEDERCHYQSWSHSDNDTDDRLRLHGEPVDVPVHRK